jgi:hypothetical protein
MCSIYERSWDRSLPYTKFSYNTSYQESLKMAIFEMLYGRRCRTPLFLNETGNGSFLDPTYCEMLRDKFIWCERTCKMCSRDRRAMPTIGKENWVLKLEIMCTSRCRLCEVYDVSRYEPNSHLGQLVYSRSRRREKKNWRHNFWISFLIHPNLKGEIHFKGVGLSHPKIPNFKMWLTFAKIWNFS